MHAESVIHLIRWTDLLWLYEHPCARCMTNLFLIVLSIVDSNWNYHSKLFTIRYVITRDLFSVVA